MRFIFVTSEWLACKPIHRSELFRILDVLQVQPSARVLSATTRLNVFIFFLLTTYLLDLLAFHSTFLNHFDLLLPPASPSPHPFFPSPALSNLYSSLSLPKTTATRSILFQMSFIYHFCFASCTTQPFPQVFKFYGKYQKVISSKQNI